MSWWPGGKAVWSILSPSPFCFIFLQRWRWGQERQVRALDTAKIRQQPHSWLSVSLASMPWWQQVSKCYGRHLVGCSKGLLPSATSPHPTWGFPQGSFLAQWPQSLDDPWQLLSNLYLSKKSCPTRHPALLGRISSLTCLSFGHPLSPNSFLTLPAALSLSSWAALVSLCLWDCKQVQSLCPHMFPTQSLRSVSHLGPQLLGGLWFYSKVNILLRSGLPSSPSCSYSQDL